MSHRSTRTVPAIALFLSPGAIALDPDLPDPLAAGWKGIPVCEQLRIDHEQRVLRCTFPPGVGHERHYHRPHFGYVIAGGSMRIVDESGTRDVDLPVGAIWESDGVAWHEVLNIGTTTATYLVIEPLDGMTAEEEHARMISVLGIGELRRGADGNPGSAFAANYDEARANDHLASLPDLLQTDEGRPVTTPDAWRDERRPELVRHFEREIYGRVPSNLPRIDWFSGEKNATRLGKHAVVVQDIEGRIGKDAHPVPKAVIPFTITWPEHVDGSVPVVLELSFGPEFLARLRERFTAEQLAEFSGGGVPWQEQVLDRGWAFASFDAARLQADSGDGLGQGIIGFANDGRPREPDEWGALRAWAWGASRIVDYLAGREEFDAGRVAVFGHSRFGKAALVAMAMDERIAAGFISSSGEGGAKLWRRPAAAASPVYDLLGAGGLAEEVYRPIGTLLADGALAFRQHELGHTPGPNWPYFLDFAARHFKR